MRFRTGVRFPSSPPEKRLFFGIVFFQRNKSLRICEMCFTREIHLRCMKYSLRECGFISFHRKRSFLFHNLRSKLFHINEVDISLNVNCIYYERESQQKQTPSGVFFCCILHRKGTRTLGVSLHYLLVFGLSVLPSR